MQSKSTFPAQIAPFSVLESLPFSRVGLRKARFERKKLNCFALLYVHINLEAIWIFLQGATWILNPSEYCVCNVGKEQG